jgi:inorganic pyrophosphatase
MNDFTVLIEIPKNSIMKNEIKDNCVYVDRKITIPYTHNYGYIQNSKIQDDGDFLDAFILGSEIQTNSRVSMSQLTPVALLYYMDKNELDAKVVYKFTQDVIGDKELCYEIESIINFLEYYKTTANHVTEIHISEDLAQIFKKRHIPIKSGDLQNSINQLIY